MTAKTNRLSMLDSSKLIYSGLIFLIYVSMYGAKNESIILINDWQILLSIVVTISFKKSRNSLITGSLKASINSSNLFLIFWLLKMFYGSF